MDSLILQALAGDARVVGVTNSDPVVPVPIEHGVAIVLGGPAGEARYDGQPDRFPEAANDEWDEALERAQRDGDAIESARAVRSRQWYAARRIVAENETTWRKFAEVLLVHGDLSAEQCRELLLPAMPAVWSDELQRHVAATEAVDDEVS